MNPEDIKALVEQLMKTGEFLAPEGFKLALQQILVYAKLDFIGAGIFFIVSIISAFLHFFVDDDGFFKFLCIVCLICTIILAMCGARYLMNPNWYAINLLINTIR